MLLALNKATGKFQQAVDVLFTKAKWQFAPVQSDSIIILFVSTKRKYRWFSTRYGDIIRSGREIEAEEVKIYYDSHWLLLMSFTLDALKFRHEWLTLYADSNTQLA